MTIAESARRAGGLEQSAIRVDLQIIADMIAPGSRVLDVGCGDGALLDFLVHVKQVDGRGLELSQAGVNACVKQGLSVVQGDADTDLENYPTGAFDYVILSQTLPATRKPDSVLRELTRIGRTAVVSFPNFGHWAARVSLSFSGRMPMTACLPTPWYQTQNIHLCTIRDFVDLCETLGIAILRGIVLSAAGRSLPHAPRGALANLLGGQAVFLLGKT